EFSSVDRLAARDRSTPATRALLLEPDGACQPTVPDNITIVPLLPKCPELNASGERLAVHARLTGSPTACSTLLMPFSITAATLGTSWRLSRLRVHSDQPTIHWMEKLGVCSRSSIWGANPDLAPRRHVERAEAGLRPHHRRHRALGDKRRVPGEGGRWRPSRPLQRSTPQPR